MVKSSTAKWELNRFWETLTFFETVPLWSKLKSMFFGSSCPPPPDIQQETVIDFTTPVTTLAEMWGALDDVVMGGVSQSSVEQNHSGALFTGFVSTANSGGFASVRTRNFSPPLNLSAYQGVQLQLKGDGKRYKFLMRDSNRWDSLAYSASFDTVRDEWITVRIPFETLRPVQRAKTVNNAPTLNLNSIQSLQFMLSKFEYDGGLNPHFEAGEFALLIGSIKVLPGDFHPPISQ